MQLHVYAVFITDGERPKVGVLLAKSQKDAFIKAVSQCKRDYPNGKVTFIKYLFDASIHTLLRGHAYKLLSEFDQVVFAAVQLEELTAKAMELMENVHAYVMALKDEIERQQQLQNQRKDNEE